MSKEKPKKVCQVCKGIENVKVRAEPYQLEINNKKVKVIVCPKCYKEMEQEI